MLSTSCISHVSGQKSCGKEFSGKILNHSRVKSTMQSQQNGCTTLFSADIVASLPSFKNRVMTYLQSRSSGVCRINDRTEFLVYSGIKNIMHKK